MDFNSFINNLRAGLAEADKQANNFINQAGNEIGRAFNLGFVQPLQAAGNQLNQWGQQIGQGVMQYGNAVENGVNQLGNAIVSTVAPRAAENANNTTNAATTGAQQGAQQIASLNNPIYQGAVPLALQGLAGTALSGAAQNQTQPTGQVQTTNLGGNTYYTDPAIDAFINTLRWITNPGSMMLGLNGGWSPLDPLLFDPMKNSMYSAFGKKYEETKAEDNKESTEETKVEETKTEDTADESDIVTYTYKPGDTFGQVILDLGLNTGKGLWGNDGDVEYYSKQLEDQLWNSGVWDRGLRQNIPIGTTIKLKRRK